MLRPCYFLLFVPFVLSGTRSGPDSIVFQQRDNSQNENTRDHVKGWTFWPSRSNHDSVIFLGDSNKKNNNDKLSYQTNHNSNTNSYETHHLESSEFTHNHGHQGTTHYFGGNINKQSQNNFLGHEQNENNFFWGQGGSGSNSNSNTLSGLPNSNKDNSFTSNKDRMNASTIKTSLLPQDSCGTDLPRRILGGTTVDIDEFPWLALLQYRDRSGKISHDCGGALISTRYVVTAAHCTIGLGVTTRKLKLEKVRLGEWDLSEDSDCQQEMCSQGVQDIEIEEIINHPQYKPRQSSQTNDIALVRLRREAKITQFVQPICLPLDSYSEINLEGKRLTVAGWGRTKNVRNSNSNIKMKVEVPVVTWEKCRSFYESFFNDVKIEKTQMCAGGEDGKDSCQGDSGGPLMSSEKVKNEFKWFLMGVVSSGPAACGVEGRPSLYTKISDFTEWILKNLRE